MLESHRRRAAALHHLRRHRRVPARGGHRLRRHRGRRDRGHADALRPHRHRRHGPPGAVLAGRPARSRPGGGAARDRGRLRPDPARPGRDGDRLGGPHPRVAPPRRARPCWARTGTTSAWSRTSGGRCWSRWPSSRPSAPTSCTRSTASGTTPTPPRCCSPTRHRRGPRRELRAAGRRLGIVTSKSRDAVDLAWAVLPDLRPLFDVVMAAEDTARHKPDAGPGAGRAGAPRRAARGRLLRGRRALRHRGRPRRRGGHDRRDLGLLRPRRPRGRPAPT